MLSYITEVRVKDLVRNGLGSKSAKVATVRARLGCCGHLAGSERPVVARVTHTATPTLASSFGKKGLLLPVWLKHFTFGMILKIM